MSRLCREAKRNMNPVPVHDGLYELPSQHSSGFHIIAIESVLSFLGKCRRFLIEFK